MFFNILSKVFQSFVKILSKISKIFKTQFSIFSTGSVRKPLIVTQSHVNERVLDHLFSAQPIHVDLRAIFPNIDSRKLVRNSSAIWKTPPKHYHTNF